MADDYDPEGSPPGWVEDRLVELTQNRSTLNALLFHIWKYEEPKAEVDSREGAKARRLSKLEENQLLDYVRWVDCPLCEGVSKSFTGGRFCRVCYNQGQLTNGGAEIARRSLLFSAMSVVGRELHQKIGDGEFYADCSTFKLVFARGSSSSFNDHIVVAKMACGESAYWLPALIAGMLNDALRAAAALRETEEGAANG
jgi:hypothetical protein